MAFKNETPAEKLVAYRVRGISKLVEHLEVRFLDANGGLGPRAIIEQKHVSEPWANFAAERLLTISCPKIKSASHRFLGSIVEVVAEGWPHLRLGFKGRDELAFYDNQKVPSFGRSEVPGEFESLPVENMASIDPCLDNQFGQ